MRHKFNIVNSFIDEQIEDSLQTLEVDHQKVKENVHTKALFLFLMLYKIYNNNKN